MRESRSLEALSISTWRLPKGQNETECYAPVKIGQKEKYHSDFEILSDWKDSQH